MSRAHKPWAGALLAAAVVAGLTATAAPSQAAHRVSPQVLATNLNNPRDITLQADGSILVAESGSGPATACAPGTSCLGFTGSIYRVNGSQKGRVVTGLPSKLEVRADGGASVAGPNQVEARSTGGYTVSSSFGGDAADRKALGAGGETLGTLHIAKGKVLGDLVDHETRLDPDGPLGNNDVHSNAWMFAHHGKDYLVTDAGGNDLIRVLPDGTTKTEFVFPNNGDLETVPTGIVAAPDGSFYISDLSGQAAGKSRIWRYVPGSAPKVFATGLTNVTDLALDGKGGLIALTLTKGYTETGPLPGALNRVDLKSGKTTEIPTADRLVNSLGLAVGKGGEIYVTNKTVGTTGELLKFPAARR
ncbi:ScyD/ScyE family protein [Streptomyces physcomitrii]|uniref:ScyD/ScyE family protein n=1 Tax=Streptomyces physcomitrii TaxID=2724184 RepID=A0ABX1H3L0_9ACTN|nr:ScyD/ScyE family protein [Streptomyces physcomitrii]NKI42623.1 ScyD/ScyE family protein [Streptomyces physcomitrii]